MDFIRFFNTSDENEIKKEFLRCAILEFSREDTDHKFLCNYADHFAFWSADYVATEEGHTKERLEIFLVLKRFLEENKPHEDSFTAHENWVGSFS